MDPVTAALTFTAGCLAIGLGLFCAGESLRLLRPQAAGAAGQSAQRHWQLSQVLCVIPLTLAVVFLIFGVSGVVRSVPW